MPGLDDAALPVAARPGGRAVLAEADPVAHGGRGPEPRLLHVLAPETDRLRVSDARADRPHQHLEA